MNSPFTADRKQAFADIRQACVDLITTLAKSPLGDNSRDLSMPEYVETEQRFRWPAAVMYLASDLESGKSLTESFNRFSAGAAPAPVKHLSGRESAFHDIYNAIDAIEKSFDLDYVPLSRESVRQWQKKHTLEDKYIHYAHKENTRHQMKESLKEIRKTLQAVEAPKAAPKHKPPQP